MIDLIYYHTKTRSSNEKKIEFAYYLISITIFTSHNSIIFDYFFKMLKISQPAIYLQICKILCKTKVKEILYKHMQDRLSSNTINAVLLQ